MTQAQNLSITIPNGSNSNGVRYGQGKTLSSSPSRKLGMTDFSSIEGSTMTITPTTAKPRRMSEQPAWRREVEHLFHKHSIPELVNIEKKTKEDVEKKKEELRTLVGARYRELLEAADTIMAMRTPANNLADILKTFRAEFGPSKLAEKAESLQKSIEGEKLQKDKLQELQIAALTKTIVDARIGITFSLRDSKILSAALIYRVSLECKNETMKNIEGLKKFMLVSEFEKKWDSVQLLKNKILNECQSQLKRIDVPLKFLNELLCAYYLLTDKTSPEILEDFLKIRGVVVEELESKFDSSNKIEMFSSMAKNYGHTLLQSAHFFIAESSQKLSPMDNSLILIKSGKWNALLESTDMANEKSHPLYMLLHEYVMDIDILIKYLPQNIVNFDKNVLNSNIESVQKPTTGLILNWSDGIVVSIKNVTQKNLLTIDSSKTLREIREQIVNISDVASKDPIIKSEKLERVFSKKLDIWEKVFREQFTERIHGLIEESWNGFSQMLLTSLLDKMKQLQQISPSENTADFHIGSFIWKNLNDPNPETSLLSPGKRFSTMTPDMVYITGEMDKLLGTIKKNLADLDGWDNAEGKLKSNLRERNKQSCLSSLKSLSSNLKKEIESFSVNTGIHESKPIIFSVVLVGRFSIYLLKNFGHIKEATFDTHQNSDHSWDEITLAFTVLFESSYNFWMKEVEKEFSRAINRYLEDQDGWQIVMSLKSVSLSEKVSLSGCSWDYYQKDDEKILLPAQPSNSLISAVDDVCREIHSCDGSSSDKNKILKKLRQNLLREFIAVLTDHLDSHKFKLVEAKALQMYFDIEFMKLVLEGTGEQKLSAFLNKLSSKFTHPKIPIILQTRARKSFDRTKMLFYFLESSEVQAMDKTSKEVESAFANENHNTISALASSNRIPPISMPFDYEDKSNEKQSVRHKESKYWALISPDEIPQKPAKQKTMARDGSFRNLAAETAPALAQLSTSIQSRLGMFGQYFKE